MSEYIKREDAIRALKKQRSDWDCDYNVPIDNCIEALKKVKSVELPTKYIAEVTIDKEDVIRYLKKNDYVRVVRCKDCKNWQAKPGEDEEDNENNGFATWYDCDKTCHICGNGNDYCSYGERKGEDNA